MNVNDVRVGEAISLPIPSHPLQPQPFRTIHTYLHEFGKQLVTNATNTIYVRANTKRVCLGQRVKAVRRLARVRELNAKPN